MHEAAREALLRPRSEGRLWTQEFKRKLARAIQHAIIGRDEFLKAHPDMSEEELNEILRKYGRVREGEAA